MNRTDVMLAMAQRLQAAGLALTPSTRPSAYLAHLGAEPWEEWWSNRVRAVQEGIQAGVWEGGLLPHGHPAPAGAQPGATYWIFLPNGSVICQYGDSPYAPETPGLAPGQLTTENVEAAIEAHVQALAEQLAVEELVQGYLAWVAEQTL